MLEMRLTPAADLAPCRRSWRARGGFTLIEIMVTFAVLAVLLTLAVPSFIAYQRNAELSASANSFMSALSVARAEAMKRQMSAFVEAGSPAHAAAANWSSGWFAYLDADNTQTYSAGDIILMEGGALPASVAVQTTDAAAAFVDPAAHRPYLMFNGSGFLRKLDGSFTTEGLLELKNVIGGEVRCVAVGPSGRMRVFKPATAHCLRDDLPADS